MLNWTKTADGYTATGVTSARVFEIVRVGKRFKLVKGNRPEFDADTIPSTLTALKSLCELIDANDAPAAPVPSVPGIVPVAPDVQPANAPIEPSLPVVEPEKPAYDPDLDPDKVLPPMPVPEGIPLDTPLPPMPNPRKPPPAERDAPLEDRLSVAVTIDRLEMYRDLAWRPRGFIRPVRRYGLGRQIAS